MITQSEKSSDRTDETRGILSNITGRLSTNDLIAVLGFSARLLIRRGAKLATETIFAVAGLLLDGGADVPPDLIPSDLRESPISVLCSLWAAMTPQAHRDGFAALVKIASGKGGGLSAREATLFNYRFWRSYGDWHKFTDKAIRADCEAMGFPYLPVPKV